MSIVVCMSVISHVHWLAVLCGKNFIVGHYMQTFQTDLLIPAIVICIMVDSIELA